jgi:hypothetical protein
MTAAWNLAVGNVSQAVGQSASANDNSWPNWDRQGQLRSGTGCQINFRVLQLKSIAIAF